MPKYRYRGKKPGVKVEVTVGRGGAHVVRFYALTARGYRLEAERVFSREDEGGQVVGGVSVFYCARSNGGS